MSNNNKKDNEITTKEYSITINITRLFKALLISIVFGLAHNFVDDKSMYSYALGVALGVLVQFIMNNDI